MIRENNHRAHPLGVIQVKKDSSNEVMLRSEGETSDGASAASFLSLETPNGVQSVA